MGSWGEPAARICLQLSTAPARLNHESMRKKAAVRLSRSQIFTDFLWRRVVDSVNNLVQRRTLEKQRASQCHEHASCCVFRSAFSKQVGLRGYFSEYWRLGWIYLLTLRERRKRLPLPMRSCVFVWQEALTSRGWTFSSKISFLSTKKISNTHTHTHIVDGGAKRNLGLPWSAGSRPTVILLINFGYFRGERSLLIVRFKTWQGTEVVSLLSTLLLQVWLIVHALRPANFSAFAFSGGPARFSHFQGVCRDFVESSKMFSLLGFVLLI